MTRILAIVGGAGHFRKHFDVDAGLLRRRAGGLAAGALRYGLEYLGPGSGDIALGIAMRFVPGWQTTSATFLADR
jgi:hypothetical protein